MLFFDLNGTVLRILSFTTLYPNAAQPRHGVFVEQRLRRLQETGAISLRVVAPVPWFPSSNPRFGEYAKYAVVPSQETRHGISVLHPRYPVLPKIGMNAAPALMAARAEPVLRKLQRDGFDFDLIDAHYYYPDGVAAAILAKRFNKPLTITARGNDLSLLPSYRIPRRWIKWAEQQASASITVCEALRERLIELGGDSAKTHTLRNGVDLQMFQPAANRAALREALGFTQKTLVLAGHLIERKGQHIAIAAMQLLPDMQLILVGNGEERRRLESQVAAAGLQDRVRFDGEQPHSKIVDYFSAADAVLLPSSREGLANVLLEAMACGSPVVATRVWGTPEVVTCDEAGVLIDERSGEALAAGIRKLFSAMPHRAKTRSHAEKFGWSSTTDAQIRLFSQLTVN